MLQRKGRVLKKLSGREGSWNVSGGMGLCGEVLGEGMGVRGMAWCGRGRSPVRGTCWVRALPPLPPTVHTEGPATARALSNWKHADSQ